MSLTLDAPLLPPIATDLESELQAHLSGLLDLTRSELGNDLVAVVLGGSLARGQGVLAGTPAGDRLLSDIDLYLVVRDPSSPAASHADVALRAFHRQSSFGDVPLDLGLVDRGWFSRLSPTMPAHQIAHGHRVLWAVDSDFELRVASVDVERKDGVDRDDALKLMMNRFAEHLLLVEHLHDSAPDPAALYHRWKLYLDLPFAWLALRGLYQPQRVDQRRQLREIWDELGQPRPAWWSDGLVMIEQIEERMRLEPLRVESLQSLRPAAEAYGADAHLEGMGHVRRGRMPELNWTWPFFRDGLRVCLGLSHANPGLGLQRAVEEGPPGSLDLVLALKWLRRNPLLPRLRNARRWASMAPGETGPWYRHGVRGIGPERVQVACALRFGGLDSWTLPLEDLLPPAEMQGVTPLVGEDLDLWLGHCWSGWVMGGSRS